MAEPTRPRRSVAAWLRAAFGMVATIVLLVCLFGILLSGPIAVQRTTLDWEVDVSVERLRDTVDVLCTRFAPRDGQDPQRLSAAADWIAEQLREAGLAVELQDYESASGLHRNVIGFQSATDSQAPVWVVGAHYQAPVGSPGADDNASGVAVLLELARTLPQRSVRPARYFVAFGPHDVQASGFDPAGAEAFLRWLDQRGQDVELMVSIDGVGYYSDERRSQRLPVAGARLFYPDRGDFVAVVGDLGSGETLLRIKRDVLTAETIPIQSFRGPTWLTPTDRSDQLPFRRAGFPAVVLTDTGRLRNPQFGGPGDTPATLDYDRMGQLVQALHAVLWDPEVPWDRPPRSR